MSPRLSSNNFPHRRVGYREHGGQFFVGDAFRRQTSHVQYLLSGQFGCGVLFSSKHLFRVFSSPVIVPTRTAFRVQSGSIPISESGTPFYCAIPGISSLGCQPEVPAPLIDNAVKFIRADVVVSDAGSVTLVSGCDQYVTGMGNDFSALRPVSGSKPPSVGVRTDAALLEVPKLSVAVTVKQANPLPAIGATDNFGPQTVAPTGAAILLGHRDLLRRLRGVSASCVVSPTPGPLAFNYTPTGGVEAGQMAVASRQADANAQLMAGQGAA